MAQAAETARKKKRAEESFYTDPAEYKRLKEQAAAEERAAEEKRKEEEARKLKEAAEEGAVVKTKERQAGQRESAESKAEKMSDEELDGWKPTTPGELAIKARVKRKRASQSNVSASDGAAALAKRMTK